MDAANIKGKEAEVLFVCLFVFSHAVRPAFLIHSKHSITCHQFNIYFEDPRLAT